MISMKPLRALYKTTFANNEVDIDGLSIFFQRTLGIPNLSYTHIIEELKTIKKQPAIRLETVHQLYQLLYQSHQGDSSTVPCKTGCHPFTRSPVFSATVGQGSLARMQIVVLRNGCKVGNNQTLDVILAGRLSLLRQMALAGKSMAVYALCSAADARPSRWCSQLYFCASRCKRNQMLQEKFLNLTSTPVNSLPLIILSLSSKLQYKFTPELDTNAAEDDRRSHGLPAAR
jgi:hypothetical protein